MQGLKQYLLPSLLAGLLAAISGCGTEVATSLKQPQTSGTGTCQNKQAQIAVYDGFLQYICGCQGTSGQVVQPNSSLSCTVQAGTTVNFLFQGTKVFHQIVSVGQPGFEASPVIDTSINSSVKLEIYPLTLNTTGTYQFEDQFNNSLKGTITVQ